MTATTATTARFVAVRAEGRYRVQDTLAAANDGPLYVAVAASRAKAEERAARLNELEAQDAADAARAQRDADHAAVIAQQEEDAKVEAARTAADAPADAREARAAELAEAVTAGQMSFDDAAAELLGGAPVVVPAAAPTNDPAEWLARVNATDAQAQADADEAEMDRMVAEAERAEDERVYAAKMERDEALMAAPAPEATQDAPAEPAVDEDTPEAPEAADAPAVASVRVPGRVVAFALAHADTYSAELRDTLAARKATKDGSRTVKLAHALRAELLGVAQDVEMDARSAVKAGDIPAVSLVLAATALQARVGATL